MIQIDAGGRGQREAGAGDGVVDGGGVLRGEAVADEIVVEPHEAADDAALVMPAGHDGLDLARRVVLIPEAGEDGDAAKVPSLAGIVAAAAGVGLEVNAVDGAGKLGVDLRDHVGPVAGIVEGVGHDVIAELAEHDSELDGGGRVEAVFVVEVEGVEGGDGGFQGLKIFIKDAGGADALGVDEGGDVLPVTDVGGADAEGDALDGALLEQRHVGGEVGIGLIADVDSAGGEGEFAVEIQITDAIDFDAPDDGFGEAGVFDFGDVGGGVLVERATAEDAGVAGLSGCLSGGECR